MLTSLGPKIISKAETTQHTVASQSEDKQENELAGTADVPDDTWDQNTYKRRYLMSTVLEELDNATKIDFSYKNSTYYDGPEKARLWDAYTEYVKITCGKNGDFNKLLSISNAAPDVVVIKEYIARVYEKFGDFDRAAEIYHELYLGSNDVAEKLKYLAKEGLIKMQDEEDAFPSSIISICRRISENTPSEHNIILKFLNEVAFEQKKNNLALSTLESMLDLDPANHTLRFKLGYEYSQNELYTLSLYHYLKIPFNERDGVTWNNIGVAYQQLGMPAKSVDAYRRAESLDDTLAMSNLANKLIDAGFINEAKVLCEKAIKIENHHKNVDKSFENLKGVEEAESKIEKSSIKASRPESVFLKNAGQGTLRDPFSANYTADFVGPDYTVKMNIQVDKFFASGTYKVRSGGLSRLLIPSSLGGQPEPGEYITYNVEYEGYRVGSAFFGTVNRYLFGTNNDTSTLLNSSKNKLSLVMWYDNEMDAFHVMEGRSSGINSMYELKNAKSTKGEGR